MIESTTSLTPRRSSASWRSYSEIAQQLGLALCGCGLEYQPIGNHEDGWTAFGMTVIHWRERRVTRRGLRSFLKLVAKATSKFGTYGETWETLYYQNLRAQELARQFSVRFPRTWSATDRARIRLSLDKITPSQMASEFPEGRVFIRRVREWARP